MQRVNLGKPYEEYIKRMVASGYYASASEVIRDALRSKMKEEKLPKKTLQELVEEGMEDIRAGRIVDYDENFWDKVHKGAEERRKNNIPVPDHLLP